MPTLPAEHIPFVPAAARNRPRDAPAWSCCLRSEHRSEHRPTISDPLRGVEIVSDADRLDAKREGSARFFDPKDGQLDLSYFLEDPRGFLPIPIIVTEPAVGYGGGSQGCSSGLAGKRATKAGRGRTSRRSARSRRRMARGVHSPAIRAGGSTGACARSSGWAPDSSILISTGSGARHLRSTRACALVAIHGRGRAGKLATRAQVPVGRRRALRLCRRGPQATQSRSFRGSPTTSG